LYLIESVLLLKLVKSMNVDADNIKIIYSLYIKKAKISINTSKHY